jgi:hypothetical protein
MTRTSRYSRISFQLSRAVIGSDDDSVGLRRRAQVTPESLGAGRAKLRLSRGFPDYPAPRHHPP